MASIDTGGGGGKGKPQRLNLRVDFTPMVDMNMLLLTFFMFCTTLSKPQIMDIAMPTNAEVEEKDRNETAESKTITLLLGADHKVYYYFGKPDYENYQSLMVADFKKEEEEKDKVVLRDVLLKRNAKAVEEMIELKRERRDNKIKEQEFTERAKKIKGGDDAQTVVIKPTNDSQYSDLVDALDEMAICSIGKYAIVKLADGDDFLLKNYESEGQYGRDNLDPSKK